MKWCGKCQKPIREGELYQQFDVDAGSAAATTVYWHKKCMGPPTAPTRRTRRP